MLVELGLVEQRYQAVREVLDHGATVIDVARRNGVARQTVHEWLRRYAARGLPGLVDGSSKPLSCPHQMGREVEARVVELHRAHPGWRTIAHRLAREGVDPVPGLTPLRWTTPPPPGPVLARQARADLKERLPVPVGQLVEDLAARRIGQGLEDVAHMLNVMQADTCL